MLHLCARQMLTTTAKVCMNFNLRIKHCSSFVLSYLIQSSVSLGICGEQIAHTDHVCPVDARYGRRSSYFRRQAAQNLHSHHIWSILNRIVACKLTRSHWRAVTRELSIMSVGQPLQDIALVELPQGALGSTSQRPESGGNASSSQKHCVLLRAGGLLSLLDMEDGRPPRLYKVHSFIIALEHTMRLN